MPSKKFSPLNLLLLSINGMIGSAWLFGAFYTSRIAGPAAILSWLIGGLIVLCIAFCFAEISSSFPVTGGMARLPYITHGPTTSFVLCFAAWLSCVAMPAIETQATLQYLSVYFPSLSHIATNGSRSLSHSGTVTAGLLMLGLASLNLLQSKKLARAHQYFSYIKISIMLLVIITLFSHYQSTNLSFYKPDQWMPYGWNGTLSAIATGGIAFSFIGFRHSIDLAGESRKPHIGIPVAILGSMAACMLLYILLQLAFSLALPPKLLNQGWASLQLGGHDNGPLIALAKLVGASWLISFILTNAIASPMGAGLTYMTSSARMSYAMSQNRQFPKFLQHLNSHQMPSRALFFNYFFSMIIFLFFTGWQSMVSFLVSAIVIAYSLAPICLLALRKQYPNHPRRFKLKMHSIFAPVAFIFCTTLSYWTGWNNIKMLLITSLAGLTYYTIQHHLFQSKQHTMDWKHAYWVLLYLLGLGILSFLGNFGGGLGILNHGIDIILLVTFSLVIIKIALSTTQDAPQLSEWLNAHHQEDGVI